MSWSMLPPSSSSSFLSADDVKSVFLGGGREEKAGRANLEVDLAWSAAEKSLLVTNAI